MSTRDCVCFQDFCAEIEVLQDEVARLREALNRIANAAEDAAVWWLQDLARAALAENEKKQ